MNYILFVGIVLLYLSLGFIGATIWHITESEFTKRDLPVVCIASILGPVVFILGWFMFIYKDRKSLLYKKQIVSMLQTAVINTEIEVLKNALKSAILERSRITHRNVDNSIDWSKDVKCWANLCDLDLDYYDPFFYQNSDTA